jgi:hypothetical protein
MVKPHGMPREALRHSSTSAMLASGSLPIIRSIRDCSTVNRFSHLTRWADEARLPACGTAGIDNKLRRLLAGQRDVGGDHGDDGIRQPLVVSIALDNQGRASFPQGAIAERKPHQDHVAAFIGHRIRPSLAHPSPWQPAPERHRLQGSKSSSKDGLEATKVPPKSLPFSECLGFTA